MVYRKNPILFKESKSVTGIISTFGNCHKPLRKIYVKGVVTKSTGNRYKVLNEEGRFVDCTFKGKFKISGIRSTNPIAVGDRVIYKLEENQETGLITEIEDRKNYMIRKASNLSKETHILAANIDLALLVLTTSRPVTQPGFIDRFLASAEAYRIPAHLLINKKDLFTREEMEEALELQAIYNKIGYKTLLISALDLDDIQTLQALIRGKICLFAGNSGVGKSTLANAIEPGLDLKTDSISSYHSKGKHTTTFAQMYPLSQGGFIIDSPGIKGFGVFDMDKYELSHFFPEIFKAGSSCRFGNCLHLDEPGCAVQAQVEQGEISYSRYESYLKILLDENDKYRKPY